MCPGQNTPALTNIIRTAVAEENVNQCIPLELIGIFQLLPSVRTNSSIKPSISSIAYYNDEQ
jgi:hypothetical protein